MEKLGKTLMAKTGINLNPFDFNAEISSEMHILNIGVGILLMIIGGALIFTVRNQERGGGKRVAGWILLCLGVVVTVLHILRIIL